MLNVARSAAVAASLAVAACGSLPVIPFDKTTAGNIHTIGVLTPDMPAHPSVRLASDVGQSFGLIGALIDASMESSRNTKLEAMNSGEGFTPQDVFASSILKSLQTQGFAAQSVAATRSGSGFLKEYPAAADTKVDAYLDISFIGIGYGYMAAGIGTSTPYRPFVYLNCKLVRASDSSVLMQDAVLYDPVFLAGTNPTKAITISPDPVYTFTDFDTLMADANKTVAGEDAAMHQTTDAVAGLLH